MSAFTPKPNNHSQPCQRIQYINRLPIPSKPQLDQNNTRNWIPLLSVANVPTTKKRGRVYYKNVSNAYVGKEYLERYRVQSAGDVLKGLNGVYNMNTRTAGGAITPNIRGITGKGRIPVTLDGTEQTVDVWLNNYGVGDRNYLDPALFRSIAVEKARPSRAA